MNVEKLLDAAAEKTGSDAATARSLNVPKSHVSNWRNGTKGRPMPAYHAARLAELIGEQWFEGALPTMAETAKTAEEKSYWLGKLKELRKAASVALLILTLSGFLDPGYSGIAHASYQSAAEEIVRTDQPRIYNARICVR